MISARQNGARTLKFNCSFDLELGYGDELGLCLSSEHLLHSEYGLGFWGNGRCTSRISSFFGACKCESALRIGYQPTRFWVITYGFGLCDVVLSSQQDCISLALRGVLSEFRAARTCASYWFDKTLSDPHSKRIDLKIVGGCARRT